MFIYGILIWFLLVFIFFIIGIILFINRFFQGKRKPDGLSEKDWYLQISLSKEDTVSQFFFLFSVFFLGITLLAFNKDLGNLLSWQNIIFLVSIIGLVVAYYFKAIYTLVSSLIGLEVWWAVQTIQWAQWAQGVEDNIKGVTLLTGLLLMSIIFYLLGRAHEAEIKFKRVSIVYSILGIIPITSILLFLSTKFGLETLANITKGSSFFVSWEITLSLFIFLILIIGILFYTLNKNLVFKSEVIVIGFLVLLSFIIALLPEQSMFLRQNYGIYRSNKLSNTGILWAIFFNILIFLDLLGVIFLGYLKRENWLINIGVFLIFILIIVKYFDWFFNFLDKSIFFIGAGILLFFIGWFMEKGRRYLLSLTKKKEVTQINN